MLENRLFNFNPGPAVLPEEVLLTAKENLLNYQGSGIGMMELSHRGKHFESIIQTAEKDLRELLSIPASFKVIFCTGGASQQFSMIPMNLLQKGEVANFILTGVWAEAALEEAKKFGSTHIAASSKDLEYKSIPKKLSLSSSPSYLHFTSNNTIIGTQFSEEPQTDGIPLICDASSDLLHKPLDITKYSLLYAGAQKNLGAAGVTIVVIHESLLERIPAGLPLMLDYKLYVKHSSLYNTPPTFPIYITGLVLQWIKKLGGLKEMEKRNRAKAALLYETIDSDDFYVPLVEKESRSLMNVTFRLKKRELEDAFTKGAEAAGLIGLKGHRLMGGCRASLYNACPMEALQALTSFMKDFSRANQ